MITASKLLELQDRLQKAWENHDEHGRVTITMADVKQLVENVLPAALAPPSGEGVWEARFRYALTLIDAAAGDGDGMAGVAFSAQTPMDLVDGKSAAQIAEMLCIDAIPDTTPQSAPEG